MKANLTTLYVDRLKPPAQGQLDIYDEKTTGLVLRVSPKGKKTWNACYRMAGRNRRLTIGVYPILSISDARREALKALRDAQLGNDPATKKRAKAEAESFGELCERFLVEYAKPRCRPRTAYEYERIIRRHLLPAWGRRSAASISRKDVIAIASALKAAGHGAMANRVLATIGVVFGFGVDHEIVALNVATRMRTVRAIEQPRTRDLSDDELRRVWKASPPILRLLMLTATRRSEVAGMLWSEVDLEQATWTLPASRTKNKRAHTVPLSRPALQILRSLDRHGDRVFPKDFVWAYERTREAAGVEGWTPHDLRRTARTALAKLGVAPHVAERILNHAPPQLIEIYDQHDYLPEMRDALERWATRVEQITGENVIALTPQAG